MVELSATIWDARDVYLILLNDNGMIYHTQTGGRIYDQEQAKGFLVPFPMYKNKEFCSAIYGLFADLYHQRADEYRLNEDPQLCKSLKMLFEEFELTDMIALDESQFDKSYNQWLHVYVKAGFHEMFTIPEEQLPLKAILTWTFNEPFHERPDYHIYEKRAAETEALLLKCKQKQNKGKN